MHMSNAHRREYQGKLHTDGAPHTHPRVYAQSHGPAAGAGASTSREAHHISHAGPSHTEDGRQSVEIVADHHGDELDAVPSGSGAHSARIVYYS